MASHDLDRPLPARTRRMVERRCAEMRARAQPLLEEGEEIQAIFPAKIGFNPGGGTWAGAFSSMDQKIVIAATDRDLVVFEARRKYEPTSVLERLPRQSRLGPPKTRPGHRAFARIALEEPTWIPSYFRFEVAVADSLLPPAEGPADS